MNRPYFWDKLRVRARKTDTFVADVRACAHQWSHLGRRSTLTPPDDGLAGVEAQLLEVGRQPDT